jgi:multicomponent Na+:H+ antiporter subunit B
MRNSNKTLTNIIALLLLIAFGYFIIDAVIITDEESGASINSASIEDRIANGFINKNVNGNHDKDIEIGSSGLEEGSANIVSSIVVNYRAFDTLGEVLVLFASAAAVGLLIGYRKRKMYKEATSIVKTSVSLISFIAVVIGIIIVIHGHLTPGGGFPGGALIASGVIFTFLTNKDVIDKKAFLIMETLSGLSIIIVAFLGIIFRGGFFENFLPNGRIGDLISAGTVPLLYLFIGIKVASEITSIGINFVGSNNQKAETQEEAI